MTGHCRQGPAHGRHRRMRSAAELAQPLQKARRTCWRRWASSARAPRSCPWTVQLATTGHAVSVTWWLPPAPGGTRRPPGPPSANRGAARARPQGDRLAVLPRPWPGRDRRGDRLLTDAGVAAAAPCPGQSARPAPGLLSGLVQQQTSRSTSLGSQRRTTRHPSRQGEGT